jgi:hypothetical protein
MPQPGSSSDSRGDRFRAAFGAAAGQAPSREVVESQRGLSAGQRRAARRAVRRGEAVSDPAVARYAVAVARMTLRRRPGTVLRVALWVIAATVGVVAILQLSHGHTVLWIASVGGLALILWASWLLRPAGARAAETAEAANRAVLEQAGTPWRSDPRGGEPVEARFPAVVAGVVGIWLWYDLSYGAVLDAFDDRRLTIGHVVGRGAIFATVMVIVNLTFMRRRTRRQARRPVG